MCERVYEREEKGSSVYRLSENANFLKFTHDILVLLHEDGEGQHGYW